MKLESLGQYHDQLVFLYICAPDQIVTEEWDERTPKDALREEFERLRTHFRFVERKVKNARLSGALRELIDTAQRAFEAGDAFTGTEVLQEFEGLVWRSKRGPIRHAIAAEARAFGDLQYFAGQESAPADYDGSEADLGSDGQRLLAAARRHFRECLKLRDREQIPPAAWWVAQDGRLETIKMRSYAKGRRTLKSLQATGLKAGALADPVVDVNGGGFIHVWVHRPDQPLASVRALLEDWRWVDTAVVFRPAVDLFEA